jgi:hypothetical protein
VALVLSLYDTRGALRDIIEERHASKPDAVRPEELEALAMDVARHVELVKSSIPASARIDRQRDAERCGS